MIKGISVAIDRGVAPLMIDGHNWRVSREELPLALRDMEVRDPTWKLFNSHVEWFH